MAQHHAASGDIIDVRPLGSAWDDHVTTAFFKSDQLELVRLLLPRGKLMQEHQVAGEITVMCIEGLIEFTAHGRKQQMAAGHLIHLAAGEPHSLHALADTTALLTICLKQG